MYVWESGCEPHWQGTNKIRIPISNWSTGVHMQCMCSVRVGCMCGLHVGSVRVVWVHCSGQCILRVLECVCSVHCGALHIRCSLIWVIKKKKKKKIMPTDLWLNIDNCIISCNNWAPPPPLNTAGALPTHELFFLTSDRASGSARITPLSPPSGTTLELHPLRFALFVLSASLLHLPRWDDDDNCTLTTFNCRETSQCALTNDVPR